MKTEDESNLLARFQITGIIEKVGSSSLHFDNVSLVNHHRTRALAVWTVKVGSRGARGVCKPEELVLGAGVPSEGYQTAGSDDGDQGKQLSLFSSSEEKIQST